MVSHVLIFQILIGINMKFTIKWLREYLDFDSTIKELSECLTGLGLEVESIINPYVYLNDFKVCLIKKVYKHPNADKLKICEVFDGLKIINVVCGAKNARENLVTVLAPVGVTLPTINKIEGIKIKKGLIRDIESNGMLCSAEELGLEKSSEGIIELNETNEIGKSFSLYPNEELIVVEIAITPNRPDCAGVLGIARDLEAAGFGKLKYKNIIKVKENFKSNITVSNELESSACPELSFRLIKGVKNISSSESLKSKFSATGIKIISSLVDITNYLTFDRCRPLHVFDSDKVKGNITLRYSKDGEEFVGLDGIKYKLDNDMIVICDDEGIISLAGIMGGERTSCDFDTRNVLLESAYFLPEKIAFAGRKLSIQSDARYRFERGIDPASTIEGLNIATQLIQERCGGEVGSIIHSGGFKSKINKIKLGTTEVSKVLGYDFDSEYIESKLRGIGCEVERKDNLFDVIPPTWRNDIQIKEDLIEEVARIFGYENIPSKPFLSNQKILRDVTTDNQKLKRKMSRNLVSRGLTELITWSFVDEKFENFINSQNKKVEISNPISNELTTLRSTLLTNLLLAVKKNYNRGYLNQNFFEIGPIFYGDQPGQQYESVFGIRCGQISNKSWIEKTRETDIFDVKSDLMSLLGFMNFSENSIHIENKGTPDYYHPRQSGTIKIGNKSLGFFGAIHPIIIKKFDLALDALCFELNLTEALGLYKTKKKSRPVFLPSPYQSSIRDFSFILDKEFLSSKLVNAIRSVDRKLIKNIKIFDCFEGEEIGESKKALAVEVIVQSEEKTLKDNELEDISDKIIQNVEKNCNAKLRN